jgi:hypothetical protein
MQRRAAAGLSVSAVMHALALVCGAPGRPPHRPPPQVTALEIETLPWPPSPTGALAEQPAGPGAPARHDRSMPPGPVAPGRAIGRRSAPARIAGDRRRSREQAGPDATRSAASAASPGTREPPAGRARRAPAAPTLPAGLPRPTAGALAMRTPGDHGGSLRRGPAGKALSRLDLQPARIVADLASSRQEPVERAPPVRAAATEQGRDPVAFAPRGGGTYELQRPGFRAELRRDGSVTFHDRPAVGIAIHPICPSCLRRELGRGLRAWWRDPRTGGISLTGLLPLLSGRFELTDLLLRRLGQDPYGHDKMRVLEATRERRVEMRRQQGREALRAALAALPGQLAALWHAPGASPAEKRHLLYLLWAESAAPDDAELAAAARSVRATILAFIRRELPRGSRLSYTPAELERLNRGRSGAQQFAPYASAR